jgi:hypothetical protein
MENCPDIEIDIEKNIGNLSEEPPRYRFVSIDPSCKGGGKGESTSGSPCYEQE